MKGHTILLNPACQAFIAFFNTNVDVAKKNPKQIFIAAAAGGYFEKFIGSGLNAERFVFAWEIYEQAILLKRDIAKIARLRESSPDAAADAYRNRLSRFDAFVAEGLSVEELEEAAPQSSMFLIALAGKVFGQNPDQLLLAHKKTIFSALESLLLRSVATVGSSRAGAWPTMLKSQPFYEQTVKNMRLRARKLK